MGYESYSKTSKDYDRTRGPIGISILLGCFAVSGRPLPLQVVLDAGCGTGSYGTELAKRVKRVDGVDASPEMIERGRRNAKAAQIADSKLAFFEGDIAELPFEDGRFDCVTINQVLHHIDDDPSAGYPRHAEVLHEIGRVMRPGGTLVVNLCSHDQVWYGWWYRDLFPDAFERFRERIIPLRTLVHLLEAAGFAHRGNLVPVDAVFQGEAYFNLVGPLESSWRSGDSVFALATDSELEQGCSRIRAMKQDGTLSRFMKQQDARRQRIGQVTFVHCQKIKDF
jgi:ubiquinone/menaquinone biosynthesis C-methylase UbiE